MFVLLLGQGEFLKTETLFWILSQIPNVIRDRCPVHQQTFDKDTSESACSGNFFVAGQEIVGQVKQDKKLCQQPP